jgi:hypothetical protein
VLGPRTILVHAVGADREMWDLILRRRASIVWCPTSNLFTLGETLSPECLQSGIPMALGSDSGLTGAGDLIDEISIASELQRVTQEDLYAMVTCRESADWVGVPDRGQSPAAALTESDPELVVIAGKIKLVATGLAEQLPPALRARLQPIELEGRRRSLVAADTRNLYDRTAAVLGDDIRLAGRRVRV